MATEREPQRRNAQLMLAALLHVRAGDREAFRWLVASLTPEETDRLMWSLSLMVSRHAGGTGKLAGEVLRVASEERRPPR